MSVRGERLRVGRTVETTVYSSACAGCNLSSELCGWNECPDRRASQPMHFRELVHPTTLAAKVAAIAGYNVTDADRRFEQATLTWQRTVPGVMAG